MRIAIGNGVRTDIWTEFLDRFGDIKVRELYAATEGNIGFINYTSRVGAVGRVNVVHRVRRRVSSRNQKAKFNNTPVGILASENSECRKSGVKFNLSRPAAVLFIV